jgi:hypothetical protein
MGLKFPTQAKPAPNSSEHLNVFFPRVKVPDIGTEDYFNTTF